MQSRDPIINKYFGKIMGSGVLISFNDAAKLATMMATHEKDEKSIMKNSYKNGYRQGLADREAQLLTPILN